MIQVSIKVGGARFRATVQAESIERAVSLASARYPGSEVSVLFPIDPEAFFIEDRALERSSILVEMPEKAAG